MSKTEWPKAFLVDLDNTLHDYRKIAHVARSALAHRTEELSGVPADEVLKRYEQLIKAEEGTVARSAHDMRTARIQRLLAALPGTVSIAPEELVKVLEDSLLREVRPFEGALEAFHQLRQTAKAMIVTEGYDDMQRAVTGRLGLSLRDDELLATHRHGVRKVDGSAYRLAHKWLNIPAADIVVVGDNWTWDVLASSEVGMCPIWVRGTAPMPADQPPNYLGSVQSFMEVPPFISELCRIRGTWQPSCDPTRERTPH